MVIQDHLNADRRNMKLTNFELKQIRGGASSISSLLNSLIKGFNSFMDIGRYLGSGIRRIIDKNICPF